MDGHTAGRQLLENMYAKYVGGQLPEILVTERGKPYFAQGGWHFSISHTKRRVFCVLSRHNVAVDAEEVDRQPDLRLADKILSPRERQYYDRAQDKTAALLRFWVLKEAAAKLSGMGLKGYPKDTEFDPDDPRVTVRDNCYVAVMEKE